LQSETLIAQNSPAAGAQATAGYEATLKAVAARLVLQLELAHEKSGTVLDFTDLQGQGTELGRFLAQELSDQLVSEAKTFALVDRANLQFLLKENKLTMEGLIDPNTSRKLGGMIGIDTIIMGTITPIGHSARLSVRAVAVDTGKIVTSQAVNLPLTDQLIELYTHGVAARMPSGTGIPDKRAAPDIRETFRRDSVKLIGRFVHFTTWARDGMMCPNGDSCATASFVVENLSGLGINGAIKRDSTSIGGCVGHERESAGLNVYGPITDFIFGTYYTSFDPAKRFIPAGAQIPVTVKIGHCGYAGSRTADVSASLTISAKGQTFEVPVSVANVPIQ
jgi:hypothetical protein